MAEAASNIPTFKLVLVGDGGTGKVSYIRVIGCAAAVVTLGALILSFLPRWRIQYPVAILTFG